MKKEKGGAILKKELIDKTPSQKSPKKRHNDQKATKEKEKGQTTHKEELTDKKQMQNEGSTPTLTLDHKKTPAEKGPGGAWRILSNPKKRGPAWRPVCL